MKTIFIFLVTALVYVFLGNNFNQEIIIPKESIRFRIIADDNTEASEEIKFKIKMLVELELSEILDEKDNFLSSKVKIENSLKRLENKVNSMLKKEKILESVQISYGSHFFPEKFYNGVKYESGFYESLVVILGNGLGNNWWCVLFPPLCNLENKNYSNEEYKLLVWEIIKKYNKS
ncbi:MAG: stage II sporulation protein R [Bacilli bacterium]|nr:stage II sporulation protein R [Bacilli bacterium]